MRPLSATTFFRFAIPSQLLRLLFVIVSVGVTSACQTNIAGRSQLMLVSENSAIVASRQAYVDTLAPLENAGKVDSDPKTVARIGRITDKLIQQAIIKRADTQNWDWSVKVIDDPKVINAWCMAGGKMAIYTGLIEQLSATDDEIAQVMGHEISHALANHSAERMSVAMANNMALSVLASSTDVGQGTLSATAVAAKLALTLPNSRQSESEADDLGIEIAAKAGFNPNAAVTLWEKMAKAGGNSGPQFLSTHPAPENRQKNLKQLIPKMMPFYEAARTKR